MSNRGSVFVYERDHAGTWTETKLTASDATNSDYFGGGVGISGDVVIVGAVGSPPQTPRRVTDLGR